MKDQNNGFPAGTQEPIAIVGMACNLPGGNRRPEAFFDFLLKKKCGIAELPEDRWLIDSFYDPNPSATAKSVTKWAGFVEDFGGFDAKFFGISPREADGMDPQQRMVLQGAVDAMHDAQIPLEEASRLSTGMFLGISQSDYRTVQEACTTTSPDYAGTGYALCIAANRVSHRLNLTGPSFAVDTACSSSLTALDQAVKNLRAGACDMALVGGVNALVHPGPFLAFSKAGMLSDTGRISTFDAAANGFVRAEGMGMIVIKPLRRAQADGDRIHAVIHATATNQDGATSTITAPSQQAQTGMLRSLFARAGIHPSAVGYVEAHGTGTPVGDPIEAAAVGTVIGQNTPDRAVFVGSSKANIGHLESGAGITGLIKAAMAVKNGVVPPNIHFKTPNPDIPFDALNLRVPTKAEPFPDTGGPNYAVVNSFGFGGANACALVSGPPAAGYDHHPVPVALPKRAVEPRVEIGEDGFPHVIPVSGASPQALAANAGALLKAVQGKGTLAQTPLADLAAALATKRSHLMYRAVILARNAQDLRAGLRAVAQEKDAPQVIKGQVQPSQNICFTFSGQGSQWWGMARDLLTRNATFAAAVAAFDAEFEPVAGWSIRAALLCDQDVSQIDDTTVTQPALFAIQSGLAALWKQLGVTPDMVAGHSIGEAAASYVANGLSLGGAAKFLSKRGAIRDQLGVKGAMAAVGMYHKDVADLLPEDGSLCIAAINGPGSTTVSGDYDALHAFVDEFEMLRPDTFIRRLTVDTAWHSHHLDAGEAWFRSEMAAIDWSVPTLPFISTVTGQPETRFDTDYGWLNLRRPVRFQAAVETAITMGATTFVELGPAATLAGPTKSTALEAGAKVTTLGSINRKDNDFDAMARAAAQLFVQGVALNWNALTGTPETFVDLPGNVWIEEQFWSASEEADATLFKGKPHPFLGLAERGNTTSWMAELTLDDFPYLRDHRMQSDVIFPAAGYVDGMMAAARKMFGADKTIEIEEAVIHEALFIASEDAVFFNTVFDAGRGRIALYTRLRDGGEDWVLRCEARLRVFDVPPPSARHAAWDAKGFKDVPLSYVYDVDPAEGFINYGDAFQTITALRLSRTKTLARISLCDDGRATQDRHHLHPTMFDGCLQILEPRMTLKKVAEGRLPGDPVCLPIGFGRMRVYGDMPDEVIVEADQFNASKDDAPSVGFRVFDLEGRLLMVVEDLRVKRLPSKAAPQADGEVPAQFVRQDLVELHDADPAPETQGRWLVLEDDQDSGADLAVAMADLGVEAIRIPRAELEDDPGGLLADTWGDAIEQGDLRGIVITWPLTLSNVAETADTDTLFDPLETVIMDLISLGEVMDFARMGTNGLPDFVCLTSGAYPAADGAATGPAILSQMPIAALMRGLATEAPEYKVRVIDFDAEMRGSPAQLAAHILTPRDESEVILRDGTCFAPRLNLMAKEDFASSMLSIPRSDAKTNFHATMQTPGVIDNVRLHEIPLAPVGPDEVRVEIRAVGLNFRDIMAVTGLLPVEAERAPAWQNLGLEFGGVIAAVGANVTAYKPGDRVMGLSKHCMQRFMSIDPRALMPVPDHVTLAEAATIPSAFATAHYALNHVGRMRKGDRVFVHVATGGVGTAAVQLAQSAGTEIFATAGNAAKRKHLRDQGVPHVMDSRSLKFADDVMQITKGAGVDVLLNSLPGDFITKGLDIMAPYGRFLEIGKRDVYEDAAIGMKALRRNVSLSVLDLAAMGEERPDLMAELFAELAQMLEAQQISPLPLTAFPISQVSDAIRFMSQAKHMGKVVVTFDEDLYQVRRDENRPVRLLDDASYLVTGGTGGFSLGVADWLSRSGAGHVVLASRSGTLDAQGDKAVSRMAKRGTQVTVTALDITDPQAVNAFVAQIQASAAPLKGIFHGAAVIKDGFANQLSDEMITSVLAPKIKGGWNLHRACVDAGVSLDFMIGFSSVAQAIGSAGQTNYIAGNAFLDALAHYRRAQGDAGTAIAWGAVAEAGFVARNAALGSYLESMGLHGLMVEDADAALDLAVTRDAPAFVFARADWAQVARANPALGPTPRLRAVLASDSGGATEVSARLLALSGEALLAAAQDFIMDEVTNVLKIDRSTIQPERPMSELGLDSLSSFELKIRLETALDCSIPVSKFLQAPSISQLSVILAAEVEAMRRAAVAAGDLQSGSASQAKGKAPAGALASNAQLGFLRDALAPMTSDCARDAMITRVDVTLPEACSAQALLAAVRQVTKRHPLVSLRIDDEGLMHFDGKGVTVVQAVDAAPMDVGQGEYVQMVQSADQAVLTLRMHQIVGDGVSARVFLDEVVAVLNAKPLVKPVPRKAVLAALARCRYVADDPASRLDRAFWTYVLGAGTATPVPFARRSRAVPAPVRGRNHGPAGSIEFVLPGAVDTAELLCGFAASLRRETKSKGPIVIGRKTSRRGVLPDAPAVGPFDIEQPLLVPQGSADPVAMAQFRRVLAAGGDHCHFDSHAAVTHLGTYFEQTKTTPFALLFEPVQTMSPEAPDRTLHDLWLQLSQDKDRTLVRLIFDRDVLDQAQAQSICDGLLPVPHPVSVA